ncbi:gamma-glutamyltransferase [Aquabacter cavernae]|uniref:gamma-glutamyltransferase n=1 Tax=Aquabacter cavernae TaxID=2496029 RepID=UPI000F8E667B|nr:gamma-glutamyltransferase [Aquabacter cavernae]
MRDFETSGRSLAVGTHGMAATSHPASTLTAIEVLKAGGNAMDAAVAACAVQCVVEPGSTGIGGDCFALYAPEGSTRIVAFNGSGRLPAAATLAWYEAQGIRAIERHSPHAVTVPGAVDAWARLVADHGRMRLSELLAPAIRMAREGFAVTPRVAFDIKINLDLLRRDPSVRSTFLVDGEAPAIGTVLHQPKLAQTLEQIGREGPQAFYRGDVAVDMVDHLRSVGGLHALEDFAAVAGEYVTPISTTYRGRTVHECPPNGQGIIALLILNILSRFALKTDALDADDLFVKTEATRLAYAERDAALADPRLAAVPVEYLLSDALADRLAARIDLSRAVHPLTVDDATEHKDTVYISVVDKDRNTVSFINSIFNAFGSALMAPKSGVLFHNRAQSFSLAAGHPNAVAPGKRPLHTIIPAMVSEGDRVTLSFGVMGGHYQAMGHAYFLSAVLDHGLDLQAAAELPRLFPKPGSDEVEMEARLRAQVGATFEARGLKVVTPPLPIGGAQAIAIDWDKGVLFGGSDPRKDGCALGY